MPNTDVNFTKRKNSLYDRMVNLQYDISVMIGLIRTGNYEELIDHAVVHKKLDQLENLQAQHIALHRSCLWDRRSTDDSTN